MSEFLRLITQEGKPEAREVEVGGQTGTVYFRRISAGEREKLVHGMKMSHKPGAGTSVEVDLGENERQRHLLVRYSVCDEDGKPFFKNIDAVQKLPNTVVSVLSRYAEEVNRLSDEETGKA